MLRFQGHFTAFLGDREAGRELLRESLDLLGRAEVLSQDTRSEQSYVCLALGLVQWATGRGDSRRSFERALALARATRDQRAAAAALYSIATCDQRDGELLAARRAGEEALTLYRLLGDVQGIGVLRNWLGWLCALQGELVAGEQLACESVRLVEDLGDPVALADARRGLAGTLTIAGKYAEGHALYEDTLAAAADLGILDSALIATCSLPWIELMTGEYEQAREHLCTAVEVAGESEVLNLAANSWAHMGMLATLEGKYAEARLLLCEAIAAFNRIADETLAVVGRRWLVYPLRALGEREAAKKAVVQVLRWAVKHDSLVINANVLHAAALLLVDHGDNERAVEVLALARTYPYLAKSQWHEDLIGRPIADAATSLPPAVVAAARERAGRATCWLPAASWRRSFEGQHRLF